MPHDVIMPALGMAQDTGLLVSWLKQPGDPVKAGDALMEVETDKSVMEVEAQADGFLARVTAAAGEHVPVGNTVAVIAETAEDGDSQGTNDVAATAVTDNGDSKASAEPASEPAALPDGETIIMPALGMAQDTGLIVSWGKEPGEAISAHDILLEVETDKSVMEVEAGHDGFVAAILADAGEAVPVGSVIAVISKDKPDAPVKRRAADAETPVAEKPVEEPGGQSEATAMQSQTAQPEAKQISGSQPGGRILASPKTKRLALEEGLDLQRLRDHGVTEPYHVSDLETLRSLGPAPGDETRSGKSTGMAELAARSVANVTARVSTTGCTSFITWMREDGQIEITPHQLWLRFATAALREAYSNELSRPLVVETRTVRRTEGRFADADRSRLSQPLESSDEMEPDLVLRDFTASPISSATALPASAAVLTIGLEQEIYLISLDYHPGHLAADQAIDFVTGFAERLDDPLKHLL